MLKMFWRILSILIFWFLSTNITLACKCNSGSTQNDFFNHADYVALIKVTATELRQSDELSQKAQEVMEGKGIVDQYIRVSFDEEEAFKGKGNAPAYLLEWIRGGGNCAFELYPGVEYVVFLRKNLMGFVRDCSGIFVFQHELDNNGEAIELKLLRKLAKNNL